MMQIYLFLFKFNIYKYIYIYTPILCMYYYDWCQSDVKLKIKICIQNIRVYKIKYFIVLNQFKWQAVYYNYVKLQFEILDRR